MTKNKKILYPVLFIFLILTACNSSKGVFVNLKNAPLTLGNLNSVETHLGELYIYNSKTKQAVYLSNVKGESLSSIVTGSNLERKLNYKVDIDFGGDIIGRKDIIRAQIAKLFSFKIEQHQSQKFRYPREILNGKENADIRMALAEDGFAEGEYQFLFIYKVITGDIVKVSAGKNNNVNVLDNIIKVNWDEKEINSINNAKEYPAIVQVSVWKLEKDNKNYRFVQDISANPSILFQQAFNKS